MSRAYNSIRRGLLAVGALLLTGAVVGNAQWVTQPSIPQARTQAMVAASNNKIFLFGGSLETSVGPTGIPSTASNAAWVMNVGGTSWTQLTALPQARTGGYAAFVNGKVYIVGGITYSGTTRAYTANVLEFDPATNQYSSKVSMPIPVWGFAGAVVGSKIYCIGGIAANGTAFAFPKTVQIYDVLTNTWSQSSNDYPIAAIYGSAVGIGQDIFVTGGVDASTFLSSQLSYKGAVSANGIIWQQIANYPKAVNSHAGGVFNNKPYFAGGQDDAGTGYRQTYYYDVASSSWKGGYGLPIALFNMTEMAYDGTSMYWIAGSGGNRPTYKLTEGTPTSVADVSPTSFVVTSAEGSPQQIEIDVTNWGVAPLDGTIDIGPTDQTWLSTSDATFTNIMPGETGKLHVNVGSASSTTGDYKATIIVKTNDAAHTDIPVTIRYYVRKTFPDQDTRVVVEESSGAWCGPCGAYGVPGIRALIDTYGDGVLPIAYHDRGGRGATADTLATTETEGIGQKFPVPYFPAAAFSRYLFPGQTSLMLGTSDWNNAAAAVLAAVPKAPVAMTIKEYKFDPATKKIDVKLELESARAFDLGNASVRVTAVILEDSIKYDQNSAPSPFWHVHVARSFAPDINGMAVVIPAEAMDENVLLPGAKVEVPMNFNLGKHARTDMCHVVFFVHVNYGTAFGPILQGTEIGLTETVKPDTGGGGTNGVEFFTTGNNGMRLMQNTPNPASSSTTFAYELPSAGTMTVDVFNMSGVKVYSADYGRVEAGSRNFNVDVASLANGVYSVRMRVNGSAVSRLMTVTH